MIRMKKTTNTFNGYRRTLLLTLMLTLLLACAFQSSADGPRPTGVSAAGSKSKTIGVGENIELHVNAKPYNADDDYLRWKIVSGSNYVRFEDNDRDGEDIDIIGVKAGTAKVQCYLSNKPSKKVNFTINVKKSSTKTIAAKDSTNVYEERWDDFDLEVKNYSSVDNLKWTIADTSIVRFDYYGGDKKTLTGTREPDFFAEKIGTTTVTCKDLGTGKSVKFTVHVVRDDD